MRDALQQGIALGEIEREVHVRIDQAGHDRALRQVDHLGPGGRDKAILHCGDLVIVHHDRDLAAFARVDAIDEVPGMDDIIARNGWGTGHSHGQRDTGQQGLLHCKAP